MTRRTFIADDARTVVQEVKKTSLVSKKQQQQQSLKASLPDGTTRKEGFHLSGESILGIRWVFLQEGEIFTHQIV